MAVRVCTVSFKGVCGVRHSVELDAETVYEAGIRGLALLKKDGWVDVVRTPTELEVRVREPETTHMISAGQLQRWCDGVSVSPAEALRKTKLKQLLGT